MGLFSFFRRKNAERTIGVDELARLMTGGESSAGVYVSERSAMQMATVWACIRLLAESIAQLPCHVYTKNRDGSKSRVTDIPLAELLAYRPNQVHTAFELHELLITALAATGNACLFPIRRSNGQVIELLPVPPWSVSFRTERGRLRYLVQVGGRTEEYGPEAIMHIRGLSLDGLVGVSPIAYHRETLGLASAAGRYGSLLFRNGARPSGTIKIPNRMSQEAYERFRDNWHETYGGGNIGKTAILEEGAEYAAMSMSNEDAQYLEVRQFQRTEICSIFRIPPHMIGDLTKSSFSNITQQSLEFVKYTILPWCRRIETAIMRDLLTEQERKKGLFVEYLVAGLERADIKTRYEAYQIGINGGFLSPNDVRLKENMNPRPGGDIYLAPLNMVDSSQGMPAGDPGAGKTGGAPAPGRTGTRAATARQIKGVEAREGLRSRYRKRFQAVAQQLVNKEVAAVRALLGEKGKAASADQLRERIEAFYQEFPATVEAELRGLVGSYAKEVRDLAVAEVDGDGEVDLGAFSTFVSGLLTAVAARHVASSSGQLAALIRDTAAELLEETIAGRLDEWAQTRSGKIAANEVVQQESAVSRFAWAAVGVTMLMWMNRGSKTCPFCESLDGKVVGIDAPFVGPGNYQPDGHDGSPWKVRGPKMHAPIHQGCVCAIVPVVGG